MPTMRKDENTRSAEKFFFPKKQFCYIWTLKHRFYDFSQKLFSTLSHKGTNNRIKYIFHTRLLVGHSFML